MTEEEKEVNFQEKIDKEIKIEAGDFNFIDHPYFSVLVKVEEIAN